MGESRIIPSLAMREDRRKNYPQIGSELFNLSVSTTAHTALSGFPGSTLAPCLTALEALKKPF
jgi:hypothetical protein